MTGPSVAIILVNWNGLADTLGCLTSLARLPGNDFGVIVCDNGSIDGSIKGLLNWGTQSPSDGLRGVCLIQPDEIYDVTLDKFLTIIDIGANLGFAGANNVGIKLALAQPSVEAVWLLNNDTEVDGKALEELRQRVSEDASVGMCGSTLIYWHDRSKVQALGVRFNLALARGEQIAWGRPPGQLPQRNEVEAALTYVVGASMYVTREFLQTVGLMEEKYFLFFEELDWSLRNHGRFRLAWAPGSIVYHKEGGSIGTQAKGRASDLAIYYQSVNLLRLMARFRPYFLPLSIFRLAFVAFRFSLKQDWRAVHVLMKAGNDFAAGKYRKGSAWLSHHPEISKNR